MKEDLTNIPVSYEEIRQYEPMIHKIINEDILRYWGRKISYTHTSVLPRLGMSIEDLMQFGRMVACEQIRWFKKYGDPNKAEMTTTVFNQLRKKFVSLSVSFCTNKRGGNVIDVGENRGTLQSFIDTFDRSLSVAENKSRLQSLLENSSPLRKKFDKQFKDNDALLRFLKKVVGCIKLTSMIDLESADYDLASNTFFNPEENMMVKEEVTRIIRESDSRITGLAPKLLVLAKDMGVDKGGIPELLDVPQEIFFKILNGRRKVTRLVRSRAEGLFGESFEELMKLTPFLV